MIKCDATGGFSSPACNSYSLPGEKTKAGQGSWDTMLIPAIPHASEAFHQQLLFV